MRRYVVHFHEVGRRIMNARSALGLTQEQFAEIAGLSTSFVGQIERGEKLPSLEAMAHLCDALDLSMDYIVRGRRYDCAKQGCALADELRGVLERYGGKA